MLTHEKLNAGRMPMKPMKLPTLGGMLLRRISVDIPIVRLLPASSSLRWLSSCAVAIAALSQTVTFLTKGGRFRQAADREKEIAQIHIQEKQDLVKGCESYERAGEWYLQEDATATANACFKDAADLHAELENYGAAIARYDQVANGSLGSNLTKYSVKDYWLRAGLCALAMGDNVGCRRNITRYTSLDLTFSSTRECKFLGFLIDALEANDQEAFTAAVVEYDQVMKLDNWKTAILLKIKRKITEEPSML